MQNTSGKQDVFFVKKKKNSKAAWEYGFYSSIVNLPRVKKKKKTIGIKK